MTVHTFTPKPKNSQALEWSEWDTWKALECERTAAIQHETGIDAESALLLCRFRSRDGGRALLTDEQRRFCEALEQRLAVAKAERVVSGAPYARPAPGAPQPTPTPPAALTYVQIARDPVPKREWAVHNRIPARNVTLLSGEGAIGKSLLALHLSVAAVLARDWIGTMPEPGHVIYLSCEDDDDEIRRRLEALATHYGTTRTEIEKRLHVISLAGKDAVLASFDHAGRIQPTPLFEQIRKDALALYSLRLIMIDTAADVFAGKENDRAQTRQFITLLRGLAIETGAAVVLLAHPSLTGIATGTGLSGNTAWHNSVRARMYMKTPDDVQDDELRVLEVRKNNYGPKAETILLRYKNGVYVPEPHTGTLEALAAQQKDDERFLALLDRFTEQNQIVTASTGGLYAPKRFADHPDANGTTSKAFAKAMQRLLDAGKIKIASEQDGPPSKRKKILVRV
jgi:RecA-family ATPase